jgi:hypothetical protein
MTACEQEPQQKKRSSSNTAESNKRSRVELQRGLQSQQQKRTTSCVAKPIVVSKGRSDDEDSDSDSDSDSDAQVTKSSFAPSTRRVLSSRAAKTKSSQSTKAVFSQVKDFTRCPRELIWQQVCR